MKALGEWQKFTASGNPSDYLAYKRKEAEEAGKESRGEHFYAGFYNCDRNNFKDGSGGGI